LEKKTDILAVARQLALTYEEAIECLQLGLSPHLDASIQGIKGKDMTLRQLKAVYTLQQYMSTWIEETDFFV
jgi:hypothetical protein